MIAKVQFLNVGWGDSHLILLPSGSITLIDGGDGGSGPVQDHPLAWMDSNGVQHLDWMILTHIHEDHLNGLLDIAKHKKVKKAILPYETFVLPSEELVLLHGNEWTGKVYRMLASYIELVQVLQQQGTDIIWRGRYSCMHDSNVWSEGGITLQHLYPWTEDPLPAYEALMKALSGHPSLSPDWLRILESFFELSNHDSSVYRLALDSDPDESVLFGGDQLEPGWERLAMRMNIKSRVWKISHHGMKDAFTARVLEWIQPEHCIIPISMERSEFLHAHWNELRSLTEAPFHITGSVPPGENRCLYRGALDIRIGF